MPTELAVLMVGVAARQAASRTAQLEALLARTAPADTLLAPPHGSFHRAMALALANWDQE